MQDEGEYNDHSVGEREIQATVYAAVAVAGIEAGGSGIGIGIGIEEGTPFRVDGQLQQLAQKQQKPDSWTQMDEDFKCRLCNLMPSLLQRRKKQERQGLYAAGLKKN